MINKKILIVATLLFVLQVMSACNKSAGDTELTKADVESDNISEGTNDLSNDSTVKAPNNDNDEMNNNHNDDKKEEGKPSQNSIQSDEQTSTENQPTSENTKENTDTPQSNGSSVDENTSKSENSEAKNAIVITSGEIAVQYLKKQLPEGKDDDVSFGVDETLASDENGSYYTIQLVSISTRVSGKTGTLGFYKVYQDGTYKPY